MKFLNEAFQAFVALLLLLKTPTEGFASYISTKGYLVPFDGEVPRLLLRDVSTNASVGGMSRERELRDEEICTIPNNNPCEIQAKNPDWQRGTTTVDNWLNSITNNNYAAYQINFGQGTAIIDQVQIKYSKVEDKTIPNSEIQLLISNDSCENWSSNSVEADLVASIIPDSTQDYWKYETTNMSIVGGSYSVIDGETSCVIVYFSKPEDSNSSNTKIINRLISITIHLAALQWVSCGGGLRLGTCPEDGGPYSRLVNPFEETHAVRCCASEANVGPNSKNNDGCGDVWGVSELSSPDDTNPGCHDNKTLRDALFICVSNGARLCTKMEVEGECTMGSGCGFDQELIWTSDTESSVQSVSPTPAPTPHPTTSPTPSPTPSPIVTTTAPTAPPTISALYEFFTGFYSTEELYTEENKLGFVIENDYVNDETSAGPITAETNFVFNKPNPGHLFGWKVAAIGDVDDDGLENIAVGAPGFDNMRGSIFVLNVNDTVRGSCKLTDFFTTDDAVAAVTINNRRFDGFKTTASYDCNSWSSCPTTLGLFANPDGVGDISFVQRLGFELSRGGDINGDGYADFIVGSPYVSETQQVFNRGTVYVVFGGPNINNIESDGFQQLQQLETSGNGWGFAIFGAVDLTTLKYSKKIRPSFAGYQTIGDIDLNGDGLHDVVVSAPTENNNGNIYVVFGKQNDDPVDLADFQQDTGSGPGGRGFKIEVNRTDCICTYGSVGKLVDNVGDINGDGLDDLGVTAGVVGVTDKEKTSWIVYGKKDDASVVVNGNEDTDEFRYITGNVHSIRLSCDTISGCQYELDGYWIGNWNKPGGFDVNGDGNSDLAVSFSYGDGGASTEVMVFVFFIDDVANADDDGGDFFNVEEAIKQNDRGFLITGLSDLTSDVFGANDNVMMIDDINGDGLADIVISIGKRWSYHSNGKPGNGGVWVVYGKKDFKSVSLSNVEQGEGGFVIFNEWALKSFASSLDTSGDVNGDGISDIVIGDWYFNGDFTRSGRILTLFGGNHSSSIHFYGSDLDDYYTSSEADEHVVGGRGNDVLKTIGGEVVVYGGAGDDTILVKDTGFRKLKGGTGYDKLELDFLDYIDLSRYIMSLRLSGFEEFILNKANISVSASSVAKLSDTTNTLIVAGSGKLDLTEAIWEQVVDNNNDGSSDNDKKYRVGFVDVTVVDGDGGILVNLSPVITTASMSVDENSQIGHSFGYLEAYDNENQQISFELLASKPTDAFDLDVTTNEVSVTGEVLFDYENQPDQVYLLARAIDSEGAYFTKKIVVRINDVNEAPEISLTWAPEIALTHIVSESATKGTLVATASAVDVDENSVFVFSIASGNDGGAFEIDPDNGKITVAVEGALDYEEQTEYVLTVVVTDAGGLTDQETLTVMVGDVNEMNKIYETVFESVHKNIFSDDDAFFFEFDESHDFQKTFSHQIGLASPLPNVKCECINVKGKFNASLEAVGGYVNATIPALVQLDFADEVTPGSTIQIRTNLVINNPQLTGETSGFNLNASIEFDQGDVVAEYTTTNGDTNTLIDISLENVSFAHSSEIGMTQFEADWTMVDDKNEASVHNYDVLIDHQVDWSSYFEIALERMGIPTLNQGYVRFDVSNIMGILHYNMLQPYLLQKTTSNQDIDFAIIDIDCVLRLEDGRDTEITFKPGDTFEYNVPANPEDNRKIEGSMECIPITKYHSRTEYELTFGYRMEFMEATVEFYNVPLQGDVTQGTNGPIGTIEGGVPVTKNVDKGEFELGGFQPMTVDVAIDLATVPSP